ncbi:hypothetical protein [uncultured Dubosiella sp.]|uniref:hypothetical protein n=1 Tax=uncultured Dubosiella sp. TaxID=1937011 RepID=UPI0027315DD8|nr:hypothetical protein [uncultured Dubosiella sp.]
MAAIALFANNGSVTTRTVRPLHALNSFSASLSEEKHSGSRYGRIGIAMWNACWTRRHAPFWIGFIG